MELVEGYINFSGTSSFFAVAIQLLFSPLLLFCMQTCRERWWWWRRVANTYMHIMYVRAGRYVSSEELQSKRGWLWNFFSLYYFALVDKRLVWLARFFFGMVAYWLGCWKCVSWWQQPTQPTLPTIFFHCWVKFVLIITFGMKLSRVVV